MDGGKQTTDAMRWLLLVAAVLVFVIGAPLFLFPDRTAFLFSWTVNPPITAAFLGAAYLAAGVIEFRASQDTDWTSARIAVPAVWVFTTLTLVATLLHIDKFHFGPDFAGFTQFVTWVWLAVYALVPLVMGALWLMQARRSGTSPAHTAPLPGWMSAVLWTQAALMLALGAALFLFPASVKALWPWALSALTARAIGAWLMGIGTLAAHMAQEGDHRRNAHASAALIVFVLLEWVAIARLSGATTDSGAAVIDWGDKRIWALVAFLATLFVVALIGWRKRAG